MASKLVNFRLGEATSRDFEAACAEAGVRKSVLLRGWVESFVASGSPCGADGTPSSNDSVDMGGSEELEDLVGWLADQSGMPKSLVRQRLKAGRVLVHGAVVRDERVSKLMLGQGVQLDGEVY